MVNKRKPAKKNVLKFPCEFPIKAIVKAESNLSQVIFDIVAKHAPNVTADDIQFRHSDKKQYLSVTITITATSQKQLDNIYRELTAHEQILFVL